MRSTRGGPDELRLERYQAIEYRSDGDPVMIIQDNENDKAWVQTDTPLAVKE
jgi:hypothetical protein